MKLVIGAGERRIEGFTHHDVQDLPGIDFICDFWDLHKYVAESSCEEIHMTHVLEHFPMGKVQDVLKRLYYFLTSKGRLYLEVPNFQWQARQIVEHPFDRQVVEYAYGGQKNEWDYHYNGFTPDILVADLVQAGFIVDEIRPNSSIECWAVKP